MMPITRTASALTLTAIALALPMSAQASSPADVDAAVNASAHAEVHLQQAQRLVTDTGTSAQAKIRKLIDRSRGELRSATATAASLAAQAESSADVDAAVEANTSVSTTLNQDAAVLADIAVQAHGRVQSKAAAALVADMRMQKKIIDGTMELAGRAGADAEQALEAAIREQQDVTAQIDASAQVAGADVGAHAKASADLAVGLGTQLVATTAETTDKVKVSVQNTAMSTLDDLKEALGDAAGRIHTTVTTAGIGNDRVAVSGRGGVTLGTLASLGVDATVRVGLGMDVGSSTRVSRLFAPLVRG
jgi:hypothetical protein